MSSAKQGGPVQPSVSVWRPLSAGEIVATGGIWAAKQRLNADVILGHCESWMERVGWTGNFDRAAAGTTASDGNSAHAGIEFVDSEVYKLLEAMAWELGRAYSADLDRRFHALASRVAAAQEADGYLHTSFGRPGQPPRYSDLESGHELYCFGHLFQAAVARLRTGHDDQLAQVARRLADHVYEQFGPAGRVAVCGHPEIEMALAELARATGERRYLELARLFVERRGTGTLAARRFGPEYFQDDMPVRAATTLRGHAVRALYLACGALDVATETGDDELIAAVRRQWANGVARRTYITGGVGSHHQDEAYGDDFELPADRAYAETCAGIASVMLSWRLLLATGEDKYADLIERTLLNSVLASPRADGHAFYYTNPLHQRTPGTVPDEDKVVHRAESGLRAPWFEVSCCPTNVARTLASVTLYFATVSDDSVQLHQYGDYRLSTALSAGTVTLQVSSDYPAGGPVTVTVIDAPPRPLTLRLRVPAWARGRAALSEAPTVRTARYAEIRRVFRAGETVTVTFPDDARATYPDPRIDAVRGTFAVERGPLVLALESLDLPPAWSVNEISADPRSITAEDGGTAIDVYRDDPAQEEWPYYAEPGGGRGERARARLIPYHEWANRGPSTMRAWLPLVRDQESPATRVRNPVSGTVLNRRLTEYLRSEERGTMAISPDEPSRDNADGVLHAGPAGSAELAEQLRQAVGQVTEWMAGYGDFAPHPSLDVPLDQLRRATGALQARLRENYPFFHPRYVGQMLKPPHPAAVIGYVSAMLINPNNHALDGGPATARMEKEVVAQLAAMFGFPEHLGHLTSSGTIANLEALFIARELRPGKSVAHSADAHYTHGRMCHLLGVDAVAVPAAADGTMDLQALEDELRGGRIGTVVATAGTTGLGAVDPVQDIVALCRRYGARVHVDAAYGGFFRLIADDSADGVAAAPFGAISACDSVVIDPHKHGLQPYGCGAVLFRDPGVARHYLHDSPYTYFTSDELHLGEISLECSRAGAAAAALWLTLQLLPLTPAGLGAALRAGRRAALAWAGLIAASDELTLFQPPALDILSYFPARPRLSEIDQASAHVLGGGMRLPAAQSLFVATYTVDGASLTARGHQVTADVPSGRILRSVLMKPETEQHVPALHQQVLSLLAGS